MRHLNTACWTVFVAFSMLAAPSASAQAPARPECVAPAKPGGGYDLTCELARRGLVETGQLDQPLRVSYAPGAIGAVAYNVSITQRSADSDAITAFSSGTLLNIAQGKFGRYDEHAVRWLASVGLDHGMIAVRADSKLKSLGELIEELKRHPTTTVLGAGGTVGSQDWMKAALVAKHAGVDPMALRYVSFEGGGETLSALLGGQIRAACGDISEAATALANGQIRVLAVFADRRLPGLLASVPTAREQGFDISWPVMRGFYMGPKVADASYEWWSARFAAMLLTPQFDTLRREAHLLPLNLTGKEMEARVDEEVARYRALSRDIGLIR